MGIRVSFCVRDHPRTPTANGTCRECHREGARLRMRLARVYRTLARHDGQCGLPKTECATRAALLERIQARTRALNAWRALGLPLTGVA